MEKTKLKIDLYKADKPTKKWMAEFTNPETGKLKTVYFGAIKESGEPYPDFTIHKDEERKARYIARHHGMGEDWSHSGIGTPGWFSRWLLWNKPTLRDSSKDTEARFPVRIIKKTKIKI